MMNRRKSARAGPVVLEALESRLLLSGTLQISEFMAINNATLADQNGDYSDWIEIHNLTGAPVDLNGWALTDSAGDLMKWRFPAVSIPGMGYLVVFASNKDRAVAGQQLHTNFQLSGGGEYLALVRPDGTVEHEYAPTYPQQAGDVSYGMTTASTMETIMPAGVEAKYAIPTGALSGWSNEVYADGSWTDDTSSLGYDNQPIGAGDTVTLVEAGAPVRVLVPSSDIGTAWHGLGFTPTGWLTGTTGVGFDSAPDYDPMIGLDIQAQMYNIRASAYLRIEFQVGNPATVTSLTLQMKRDDGFVAWINGTKVQSVGAPTTLLWNSGATGSVSPEPTPAGSYISYDITSYLSSLVAGTNVLAIQGLNVTAGNGDFLILPRLEANVNSTPTYAYDGYFDTDMEAAMAGVNSTAYVRIPFQVQGSALPSSLALKMKYDDGFVAYINGTKVASRNAPTTPAWNSTATAEHLDSAAVVYEVIDISAYISSLHLGANMLAIQGLNLTASDSDFLLVPEMDAVWTQTVEDLTRYFTVPTPGAANGTGAADLGPIITNAAFGPQIPTDAQDITVTARIRQAFSPITDVNMKYCVNFGGEVNVTMSDDGLHGDGAAGDGVYGATIPASASTPGQMVRFRLTAQDATTTSQWPLFDDSTGERQSAKYLGTVVQDTSYAATQLPVFMYFVQSATAADSRTGTRGAVYYNGELYDNVFIRERGGTINGGIAEGAGQSRKIKFNDDHRFLIDPSRPRVGDININAAGPQDESYLRQVLSFWLYDQSGGVAETTFLMHCRQNGLYMGVRVFHDQMDADKLALEGLDKDGPLYYMYNKLTTSSYSNVRIDNPKPNTTYPNDLHDLAYGVDPANANRHTYVMDNLDLPALVNYLAVEALIQDGDCTTHNWSTYRDPDTGEWQIIGHDRDLTFGSWVDAGADWSRVTTFGDSSNNYSGDRYWMHPFYAASEFPHADYNGRGWVVLIDAIHDDPIAHEMFYRRLRTLMDQFYGAPGEPAQWTINAKIDELVASLSYEVDNGLLPPQGGGSAANFLIEINNLKNNYVNKRRNYLYGVLGPYMRYNLPTNLNWVTAGAGDQYAPAAQPAAFAGQITIGTVEYAPASGNQDEEYIQLVNPNAYAVDISGWRFASAVDYTFPSGTVIVAGGSLYVSPNSAAFRARTTGPRGGQGLFVQDAYQGKLASDGEVVRLLDPNGNLIASKAFGGETVVINELLANSHGGAKDWIELYNPSNSPVDVGNWYLSNSQTNLIKYRIPVGTVIGANSYVVFNQLDQFGAAFDLNHEGDDVYLTNATGTYIVDSRDFNASDDLVTLGRYLTSEGRYEFTALSAATLGAANAAPLVGPVVISEIMYHPLSGNDEYVELHNITDLPVSLYDPAQPSQTWTLSGGVDYTFPTGLEILAHGYAVVTGADVSTPAAEAAFRAKYAIPAGVLVRGPWNGVLNNAGEDVNLNKPGETDPLAGTYGHVRVDRVEYQPDYPWPVAADGTGKFLERINDDQFGNDPVNWQASDGAPWVFIDDVSLTEGNSGTVNAIFTVSLNKASGLLVTVQYATADGTAVQPGDYTSASGMLTFNPGVTSQTVTVPVKGDTLDEDNETFLVNLSSPSNATIADSQGVGTITDDDPVPGLSINDVTVTEGNSGTVNAVFTVSLSAASGRTVTVQYATANGTAVQPGDYTSASGTLTFNPGVTSQTVTVPVKGDTLDEDNETFYVNLSSPSNATISDSQGVGTINDNDSAPSLSINDVAVTEGDSGTVDAVFTVSLSAASGRTVTVQYATADGTAVQPGDYTSASGTLTFNPGVTSQTVTVPVKGDTLDEDNETFLVNLSSPTNAAIGDGQGIGTINDNDSAPSLSINDVAVTEGDSGTVDAVFTVSLSAASGRTVTVQYATADGTAVQPGDYTSASGTLTFNPGVTSQTVTVPVVGDMLDEADSETFVVNLSTPVNATVADSQGTGTINDNDSTPSVLSRCIFYNASIWDWSVDADANHNGQFDLGEDGSNDDAAIATDKVALLPGETSGATNRTGYAKGINGIMVDIAGLPNPAGLSAADFAFKVGTGSDPSAWDPAPAPQGVTVRQGAGLNGSDRVTIIWANEQITGTWLQVTVLANPNTGLASQDVFYFGNLPADFNSDGVVDYLDLGALATKYRNTVGSLSQGDANGDGVADYLDLGILASNYRKSVAGNEQAEPEALLALSSPSHDSAGDLSSAEASPARADAEPAVQVVDLLGLTRQPQPMAAGAAAKSSAFGAATRRRQSTGAGWPGIISPLDMDILATPPG